MARPNLPTEPVAEPPPEAGSGTSGLADAGRARFWSDERRAGVLLVAAAVLAVVWASGPWPASYTQAWSSPLRLGVLGSWLPDGRAWVDSGAMTVFFVVVGVEIGQERATGVLAHWRHAVVPVIAAAGGMGGAAAVYLAVVHGGVGTAGWGVPMATDIAFVAGAAGLLGHRVPSSLRLFLVTLAVADDVGSVVVLAFVSGHHLSPAPLAASGVVVVVLAAGRRRWLGPWPAVVGLVPLWVGMAAGGVEPALAGVVVGLLVPARSGPVLYRWLRPWSAAMVLPLFALANAGVDLRRPLFSASGALVVFAAVVVARMVGKLVGVASAARATAWMIGARSVTGARSVIDLDMGTVRLVGGAALTGMGFTVPLLFAAVVFAGQPGLFTAAQVGLLAGTAGSGLVGAVFLAR